jgi:hypothetical protein
MIGWSGHYDGRFDLGWGVEVAYFFHPSILGAGDAIRYGGRLHAASPIMFSGCQRSGRRALGERGVASCAGESWLRG